MDEHLEHIKAIKRLVGDFLGEIAEEKKVNGSNVAVVKEAVSAYEKCKRLCEDAEDEARYGARRRDSRGRYMDGRSRPMYGTYMPGPYYDGRYMDGDDKAGLADELERMAQGGGSEGMMTALREAARWLRQG